MRNELPEMIIALPEKGVPVSLDEIKDLCLLFQKNALWERIIKHPPPVIFRSDGCTLCPDIIKGIDLYDICFWHDVEYWVGGTEAERLMADCQLCFAVAKEGLPEMAEIMFRAVRTCVRIYIEANPK